jgi:glucosamine--fructose-6-phosphate aminotransferase (isomerizing)
MALAGVTDQIVYLEEGDLVDLQLGSTGSLAKTKITPSARSKPVLAHSGAAELGLPPLHAKEIFEQPRFIADTLEGVAASCQAAGDGAHRDFNAIDNDAHPGLRHQLLAAAASTGWKRFGIPCQVEWPANTATAPACPTPPWW